MKPSALRIRAISRLVREAGTTTSVWRARDALRTRVSMSAIGSELFMQDLPARLGDAGQLARQGALPETDAAQGEAAHERPRPAADGAAVVSPDAELRLPACLRDHRFLGHSFPSPPTRRRACRGARAVASIPRRTSPSSRC